MNFVFIVLYCGQSTGRSSYSIELFLPPSGSLAHSEIVVGEKVVTGLATRSLSPPGGGLCINYLQ